MKSEFLTITLFTILLLSACAPATAPAPTPDVNAIYTSAAYTVVAEFTLTAAAFSPTPEPPTETPTLELPTATATQGFTSNPTLVALGTPAELCDDYSFVADVTIPDGTEMVPNQTFTKTWKIKNTGICTWGAGYSLIYSYAERMSGKPQPLSAVVRPGEEVDVSVDFKAPEKAGQYISAWVMVNPKGIPFGNKQNTMILNIVIK